MLSRREVKRFPASPLPRSQMRKRFASSLHWKRFSNRAQANNTPLRRSNEALPT